MKLRGSSRATSCSLRALVYHNIPTNTLAQCSQLGAVNNPQRSKPKNTAKSCSSLPEPSVMHRFPSCTYQLKGPSRIPTKTSIPGMIITATQLQTNIFWNLQHCPSQVPVELKLRTVLGRVAWNHSTCYFLGFLRTPVTKYCLNPFPANSWCSAY